MHTLNLRLHPNELAFTANHARDRYLIVDDVLLPVYESFRGQVHFERVFVAPFGGAAIPREFERYEDFLSAADDDFQYPEIEENEAATVCFTSGTTGKAKGVVYSHRALVLHSMAECIDGTFGISHGDVILGVLLDVSRQRVGNSLHGGDDGGEAGASGAAPRCRGPARPDRAGGSHAGGGSADAVVQRAAGAGEQSGAMENQAPAPDRVRRRGGARGAVSRARPLRHSRSPDLGNDGNGADGEHGHDQVHAGGMLGRRGIQNPHEARDCPRRSWRCA